jgi:hypothetical protein
MASRCENVLSFIGLLTSNFFGFFFTFLFEELDGPVIRALRRAIAEVKLCWLLIGWVTKNLLSQTPPCFGRRVEPLVPAAFAVVSTRSNFKEG